jgi:hypothetical protein
MAGRRSPRRTVGALAFANTRKKATDLLCLEWYSRSGKPLRGGLLAFGFADEAFEPGHVGDSEVVALAPQQTG